MLNTGKHTCLSWTNNKQNVIIVCLLNDLIAEWIIKHESLIIFNTFCLKNNTCILLYKADGPTLRKKLHCVMFYWPFHKKVSVKHNVFSSHNVCEVDFIIRYQFFIENNYSFIRKNEIIFLFYFFSASLTVAW